MISANLATIESRKHILPKVIKSLLPQVDVVRVYANDYTPEYDHERVVIQTGKDYTDNSKFYFLNQDDDVYFSCDDDLLYPPDYVERSLHYLNKYPNAWLSYHGRRLRGKDLNYYHGHDQYSCLRDVKGCWEIDVPGTGVSFFKPKNIQFDIREWEYFRMSDLMAGLEIAKQGMKCIVVDHRIMWIGYLLKKEPTIYERHKNDCVTQGRIANIIYDLRE